jgi:glycerol uptake facilitator-like aquaporin
MIISSAAPAHAYLDPGTGSYIFQLLLGSILGSLMVVKIYWRQIQDTISRWMGKKPLE